MIKAENLKKKKIITFFLSPSEREVCQATKYQKGTSSSKDRQNTKRSIPLAECGRLRWSPHRQVRRSQFKKEQRVKGQMWANVILEQMEVQNISEIRINLQDFTTGLH